MAFSTPKKARILVLRFHAFGDLIATLPYLNAIRKAHPEARIDLLTAARVRLIPDSIHLFDRVIGVKGGMKAKWLFFWTMLKIPLLLLQNYTMVINLQGDRKAGWVSRILGQHQQVTFDKYGPYFAGLRYQNLIQALGFKTTADFSIALKSPAVGLSKLQSAGWDGESKLIVVNPAGFYVTRNWPITNYLAFIALLEQELKDDFNILMLGDDRIAEKAQIISEAFPERCINLVGKTTQLEAFSSLPYVHLMLSEDSGLAHMAWTQGVKTCLMLGSTRADWTAPPYEHVINLTSSDLACGNCMQAVCKHGDVRCLLRYSPEFVFSKIAKWL
jgi:ADP-heptose:LPS heptosyltransferase